jgi:diguanylate cyclase (GGDEF)-like protein/PAS domain S-box-containing protein
VDTTIPTAGQHPTEWPGVGLAESLRSSGLGLLLVSEDSTVELASNMANVLWGRVLRGARLIDLVEEHHRSGLGLALGTGSIFEAVMATETGSVLVCRSGPVTDPASPAHPRWFVLAEASAHLARIKTLEAAHERNVALLDAMPDLLFRISSDLTFLDYRDPTLHGLGLAPADFLGKRLSDFLPAEIVELVEPNLVEALASGRTLTYPSSYDYADGRHTFDNRVVKSGPDEVVLICRDTTEQTNAAAELRRSQARLRAIVQYSREYTTISDHDQIIRFASEPVERILGYAPAELVGTHALALVHPEDIAASRSASRELLSSTAGALSPLRVRMHHKSGEWRLIEATAKMLFDDELIGGLLTHCRDITDYAQVETTLRDSLGRLDAIVETAADGIVTLNGGGIIESINSAAQAMFGYPGKEIVGRRFATLLTPRSRVVFGQAFLEAVGAAPASPVGLPGEVDGLRRDGTSFPVTLSASLVAVEDGLAITVIARDVSDQRALQHQLAYQASHDALTGLPNRPQFMTSLERAFRQTSAGPMAAAMFVDLDRFKIVNDSLGHAAGDKLLTVAAERLAAGVRGDGMIARFGGDEFLVLCRGCRNRSDVEAIAARVLAGLEAPIELEGTQVFVSASAGVAIFRPGDPALETEAIIRNADIALCRAKSLGRSRYEVYESRLDRRSVERLATETALRKGLETGEFVTHFQPVWGLDRAEYVGTEALIRWRRDGKLTHPSSFIPVAEESGLINDIGAWILRDACTQTVQWQHSLGLPRLSVAVNVSGCQLDQPGFPSILEEILGTTGIPPQTVILEITETKLVHDDEVTLRTLRRLSATGIKLAIDDFGTGYSSLGYLRHLPVDIIKIDRCFVSRIEDDAQTAEIVRTITTLAHTLAMTVVAEGVETVGQLAAVTSSGCDCVQGFLFATPTPASAASKVLRHAPITASVGPSPAQSSLISPSCMRG